MEEGKYLSSGGQIKRLPNEREIQEQQKAIDAHNALVEASRPGGKAMPTTNQVRQPLYPAAQALEKER